MSIKNVLYIRPPKSSTTGIRSYSSVMLEVMKNYCSNEFNFVDLTSDADFEANVYTSFSIKTLRQYLVKLKTEGNFSETSIIMAEVGLNEYVEFFILMELKTLLREVPSFITLHDPPRTIMNLNPFFSTYEKYVVARGIRRIYNKLFGAILERDFFMQGHNYIVLSHRGVQVFEQRLKSIKIVDPPIYYLSHVNCIDETYDVLTPDNLQKKIFTFGYLGFINPQKGIDLIIEAFGKLESQTSVRVIIAGGARQNSDKKYLDHLKNLILKNKFTSHFEFTGYLQNDNICDFLCQVDVMILPYRKTDSGSASGPFMWARSLGIPVIASNTRSFPENIEHGKDGLLFDAEDIHSLKDCMQSVLESNMLFHRLREGALKRKEECSFSSTALKVKELLDKPVPR